MCLELLPLASARCALILAEPAADNEPPSAVDSRQLMTVIALRQKLNEVRDVSLKCKVVTELLDPKTQQVLDRNDSIRRLGSFVYSNCVATGVFATAAAEKTIYNIWKELLEPGSTCGHIAAIRAREYVRGTEDLSFYDLHSRVWNAGGAILLGWRQFRKRYPELNPADKDKTSLWSDAAGDELIVLMPWSVPRESGY